MNLDVIRMHGQFLEVAVPSTVDNDLAMVDTSFGFDTACTEVGAGDVWS